MFTVRDTYEAVLTELNKKSSPSFSREEFGYFLNKESLSIANSGYQFYAMNGRLSDEYRYLRSKVEGVIDSNEYILDLIEDALAGTTLFHFSGDTENVVAGDIFQLGTQSLIIASVESEGENLFAITSTEALIEDNIVNLGQVLNFRLQGGIRSFGMSEDLLKVGDDFYAEPDFPVELQTVLTEEGKDEFDEIWWYTSTPTDEGLINGNFIRIVPHIPFQRSFVTEESIDLVGNTEINLLLTHDNYFHILLCSIYIEGKTPTGADAVKQFVAKRLKDDTEGAIYDNVWMEPKYNRPYYDITNSLDYLLPFGESRNSATVEIKLGNLPSSMSVSYISLDYLKLPKIINVTEDDLYGISTDNSQILEFPETLRTKFITGVTEGLLEYANNPRTQTLPQISNDIPPIPVELLMGNKPATNNNQQ